MKATREVRQWVNRVRRRVGKKNGVVPGGYFDDPKMDRAKCRRLREKPRHSGPASGPADR